MKSYGLFQSSITRDMTLAQLRVPSLTVRLYSSEQGKSEILRLNLHIMSNEIFCANCISMLDCLSNNALLRYTKRLQKDSRTKSIIKENNNYKLLKKGSHKLHYVRK